MDDDFWTPAIPLSNLRAFPFDKIKIDRSFIRSVTEKALPDSFWQLVQ